MAYTRKDWQAASAAVEAIEAERRALLSPTDEKYHAALDRLEVIEDDMGALVSKCEDCARPIFDGEPYLTDRESGIYQCKACAPTWDEMLRSHEEWISTETGEPMTKEEAQAWADRHVENGGKMTDSMAT